MQLCIPTRRDMLIEAKGIVQRLEELCQQEYRRIELSTIAIRESQERLTKLEDEYGRAERLVKKLEGKQ
jgi:hypothetical protein